LKNAVLSKWPIFPRIVAIPDVDLRAEFGTLYDDQLFADLYPPSGRPVEVAPWRLALVVVMQYIEGLTDRQAADAVRRCMDWKYALSLELTDPGFDFTLLHDFRCRILGRVCKVYRTFNHEMVAAISHMAL
jgi:transposase